MATTHKKMLDSISLREMHSKATRTAAHTRDDSYSQHSWEEVLSRTGWGGERNAGTQQV